MDFATTKRLLRTSLRQRILVMPEDVRAAEERELAEVFEHLPGFAAADTVLLYVSAFAEEFATRPLLEKALELGKRLICPRVIRRESRLALYAINNLETDFVAGTLGIPEPRIDGVEVAPSAVDWVLVPGLGFDAKCYRIGRGAGLYDRLLPTLRQEVPQWSLCLTSQWVDALPVEPHDQPLNGVVDAHRVVTRL